MSDLVRRLLYLPEQGSTFAAEVDALHFVVIGITMLGATGVFVTALWFTFRYRRREETQVTPLVRASPLVEVFVVGGLLSLFLFFWVIGFRQYVKIQAVPEGAMEVYVTAKKWMWKFEYPEGRRTAGVLVVPAGRPVKLIMTSRDVIHSFFVPAFRTKQDVLPGRYTSLWFEAARPGTYPVYCAEYCGTRHSEMWAEVVALDAAAWDTWLQGPTQDDPVAKAIAAQGGPRAVGLRIEQDDDAGRTMAQRGLDVAARRGCLSCHSLDGQRHLGPSFRGLYGRYEQLDDGTRVLADEAYLTRSMMEPHAQVVASYAPIMPTYQGQLEPAEVGALLELIKSLRWPLPLPEGIAYPKAATLPDVTREQTP